MPSAKPLPTIERSQMAGFFVLTIPGLCLIVLILLIVRIGSSDFIKRQNDRTQRYRKLGINKYSIGKNAVRWHDVKYIGIA